jgi:glutathione synthase/RimK-type ligase-like ATP-grasp enzyme
MTVRIGIVTVAEDLHARAVAHELRQRPNTECTIVVADQLAGSDSLMWHASSGGRALVPTTAGPLDVSTVDVMWWRRFNAPDRIELPHLSQGQLDVVRNDCKATLRGILLTEFSGTWVSSPTETDLADNKLFQLRAAAAAGLTVPKTLVSNDPAIIRDFCRALDNQVVVKVVHGARTIGGVATRMINDEVLADTDSLRLCPTIYQEYVPGNQHVRAHVFGGDIHAALLESDRIDWRVDHTTPMTTWSVPTDLAQMLHEVVRRLGLRMGIVDIKLDLAGNAVWLELNPQGQFLFVEAMSGIPLIKLMADFLLAEARRPGRS